MDRIDLSGQVAIVTGAGRGVGRAHALMLASRGASVVVNDLGVQPDGSGADADVAHVVVDEIVAAGGAAVASTDNVATPSGGDAIVRRALDVYGRVDILVHNAGMVRPGFFADQLIEDVRATIEVHLLGAYHVGQPAWRDMASRRYGRIVFTTSGGAYGHPTVGAYGAAKMGVIGLAKTLRLEAEMAGIDIKTNVISPIAATRLARESQTARFDGLMDPANVAAVVAYLVSPACLLSGETLHGGGSHVARAFVGVTVGWALGRNALTPEDVGDHLADAFDLTDFIIPRDGNEVTDVIHRRATGRAEELGDQILPSEIRAASGVDVE